MVKNNNILRARNVMALGILLLIFVPSLVCATPMVATFDDGNILATVAITSEALEGGQWMYTYTLTNDEAGATLSRMYIGWEFDDTGQPITSAVEVGVLGDNGEKVASSYVPPVSPYETVVYNGITFWDWGITLSSTFRFDLAPGETLDTVYVVYDDFLSDQNIFLGGSPGLSEDIDHGEQPSSPVPEPGTLLLVGTGLFGLGVFGRRKFKSL